MAYTPLNINDIQAGKPTKEEIFDTIRSNQESFNLDIEALKQTAQIDIFNLIFGGDTKRYRASQISERIPVYRAPVGASIINFKIVLLEASTSGTLGIDIEKSVNEGVTWEPILSSPVELTGTTIGSVSGAVDFLTPNSQNFNQGDLLRLVIPTVQVDQGNFHISVSGELGGS